MVTDPRRVAAAVAGRNDRLADRRAVIVRYARLKGDGTPVFCQASRAERDRQRHRDWGSEGKPIYPDLAAAEAAARELEALGARPMYAYECPRSRSGHHHLSTDTEGAA